MVHTGELEAISVTLSGVLVRNAMYCKALYPPMPISPSVPR